MKLVAKTLFGLEKILCNEISILGAKNPVIVNRAVLFEGDQRILYKINYCSRTALSVLAIISEFRIRSADDLYRNAMKIEWGNFLGPRQSFSIVAVVHSPLFTHTGFPALKLKDAIADWYRMKTGKRPSVNSTDPDIVFNLHISNSQVTVSVDSSVVPLFKRGYRKEQGPAPLNEVLGAGIVLLSGWKGDSCLIDPMCGSGTIAIEAAMIASNLPPGKFRDSFGFTKWPGFSNDIFNLVKEESDSRAAEPASDIYCSDISADAVGIARKNIDSAGLTDVIHVQRQDFRDLKAETGTGYLIMNPPYGERLKQFDSNELYSMIGSTLKHNFSGFKAFIISSDRDALKHVGLKPGGKTTLFNGSLECTLAEYDLYKGSVKNSSRISPDS